MAIIVTSLISLIFAFLFFFLKEKKNSSGTLSLFYLIWGIIFLSLFVATEEKIVRFNETAVAAFALLFFPFFIALPPLVFIYTSNYLKRELKELFPHLYIPILVLLINSFSFLYFNFSEDNKSFLYEVCENVMTYTNYLVVLFIFPISNVFYLVKSFKLISKVRKDNNKTVFFNFKWITFFVWSYLLLILFLFVAQSKIFSNVFQITFVWFIGLYFTILAFYGYKTEKSLASILEGVNLDNELNAFETIDERLKNLIEKEKVFLDPKLTIKKLARLADTNEKYLSNLLNSKYNKNFATFINYYRIEYAKIVLLDSEYSNYTIESLASLVGFNSKSVFNATFKKATNSTPSVYKLNKKGAN